VVGACPTPVGRATAQSTRTFSGNGAGASGIDLGPFISALHVAFAAGVVASVIGAGISLMRGGHRSWAAESADGEAAAADGEAAAADVLIGDAESGAMI
jgi:hypothetical protein